MGASQRHKGHEGEIEARDFMRAAGDTDCETTRAAAGGGGEAAGITGRDLVRTPGWCVQAMKSKEPRIWIKFMEAVRAAQPGEVPLAFTRRTTGPLAGRVMLVTMPAEAYVRLRQASRMAGQQEWEREAREWRAAYEAIRAGAREPIFIRMAGASGDKHAPPRGPGFPASTVPNGPETTPARPLTLFEKGDEHETA